MIDILEIIKEEGPIRKFDGISPEGFILVHENTLEDLKDFEIWKKWKNNQLTVKEMNNKHFDKN